MTSAPMASGTLLWVRAAVLSLVALSAGAVAHVQADGLLPGPGVLVALVGCGTLSFAPFLRRPGSTQRIVLLLVGGQSVVHVALAATAGHRGDAVARAVAPVGRRCRHRRAAGAPTSTWPTPPWLVNPWPVTTGPG